MSNFKRIMSNKITWIVAGVFVAIWILWSMIAAMLIEVPPEHVGVVYKKTGDTLPEGEEVAPDDSYQGVQKEILKPGWHFVNPISTSVDIEKATFVPWRRSTPRRRPWGSLFPPRIAPSVERWAPGPSAGASGCGPRVPARRSTW